MTADQEVNAQLLGSFFQFKAEYEEPMIQLWDSGRGAMAEAIFRALRPWGISLGNVSGKLNPSNFAELEVSINIPEKVRIGVGIGAVTFDFRNWNWNQSADLMLLIGAVFGPLQSVCNVHLQKQTSTISIHVRPLYATAREVTSPFVNLGAVLRPGEEVRTFAFGFYAEDGYCLVDSSALFEGAIFLKIVQSFPGNLDLESLANLVRDRENVLFNALGLRIE